MTETRPERRMAADRHEANSLSGLRVCCSLKSSHPKRNARALKIAEALYAAGAEVTILFIGSSEDLPTGPFTGVRVRPARLLQPSEHPTWLARVAFNIAIANPMNRILHWAQERGLDPALLTGLYSAKADVYHAYVLDTAVAASIVSRLRRAKFVFDERDFFVDSRRASLDERQVEYWSREDKRVARRADAVLAISEPMADVIRESTNRHNVHVIYNGAWECNERPDSVGEPVRILFQGFFEGDRNLESLVGAMTWLRGRAVLTLQGWGGCEEQLRAQVEEMALRDIVSFVPPADPRDVVRAGRQHDIGVVCHRGATLNHEIAVPNKIMDYIGAGLAIAGSDLAGIRSIVQRYDCGYLVDPANAETMATGLSAMVEDLDRLNRMKQNSAVACAELCWSQQGRKLVDIYASITRDAARERN